MTLHASSLSKLSALLVFAWLGASLLGSAAAETSPDVHAHHQQSARTIEDIEHSEFNHRTAGMGVLFMGFLALGMEAGIARRPNLHAMRWLWPASWIVLGGFLFMRNDPHNWPWGTIGLMDTWSAPDTLQHQIFVVVVVTIGAVEGLQVGGRLNGPRWRFFFPVLAIASGMLLGLHTQVHAHTPHVYVQHAVMTVLAISIGTSKLLRERGTLQGRYGSLMWPVLLMLLGAQLLFYTEH